jgi:hypothetical protein
MYYSEHSPSPLRESSFEIENPAPGPPDLSKVGIKAFGCPAQFKDAGPERDTYDKGETGTLNETKLPSMVILQLKKEWRENLQKYQPTNKNPIPKCRIPRS